MKKNHLATMFIIALTIPYAASAAMPSNQAQTPHKRKALGPIALDVNATDEARKLFHVHETMPVKPGPLTLWYPKWIPGEHSPAGPIVNVAGLVFKANGQTLAWRRDPLDIYTFHLDIPENASKLDVSFDFLSPPGTGAPNLVDLNWNEVALYPKVKSTHHLIYKPSLKLPPNWELATALSVADKSGNSIHFKPVSFNNLVDSPVIAGENFKRVDLSPGTPLAEHLDIVSDNAAALAITGKEIKHLRNLIKQAKALFGSHHYLHYDFLLTLTDHALGGLEHHQSSDDRAGEQYLVNPQHLRVFADILPHEYTHSWNGKFRRPAGLWQPNFEKPEKSKMLWVYEGLTVYFGRVLTARSGLWSKQDFRQALAVRAAAMDHRRGREWRPLIDTAIAAQILYRAPLTAWSNWRRRTDFYQEGQLLWLSVDTKIRALSHGKRSLGDFAKLFYGMDKGSIVTKTYTFDDVVAALNKVQPYNWAKFLRARLDRTEDRAPLKGITRGGWKLIYTDKPSNYQEAYRSVNRLIYAFYGNMQFGIGLSLDETGKVNDVLWNGPAFKAGLGPGMQLVAVNGREFSQKALKDAIAAAQKSKAPIHLLVNNQGTYKTYAIDYHGGLKYPHLVREPGKPDYLDQILKPLAVKH